MPIFGNGDDSPEKALKYKNEYGIDGIMIGRAAIGYPWILMKLSIILILENIWLNRQLLIECKQYVIILRGRWNGKERLGIVEDPIIQLFKGIHSLSHTN
jgi:tRNA-dihydrouridine synthase